MLEYEKGPGHVMRRLVSEAIGNQFDRLGRDGASSEGWPRVVKSSFGLLAVPVGEDNMEASFFTAYERLMALDNLAGPEVAAEALRFSADDGRILPHPRNSDVYLQLGDRIELGQHHAASRVGLVQCILKPDHKGVARPVSAIERWSGRFPDTVVELKLPGTVTSMRLGDLPPPATPRGADRAHVPMLRRLHQQARRLFDLRVRAIRSGYGWDDGLLNLCAMLATTRRAIAPAPETPELGTRAYIRMHQADLRDLSRSLQAPRERIVRKAELVASIDIHLAVLGERMKRMHGAERERKAAASMAM